VGREKMKLIKQSVKDIIKQYGGEVNILSPASKNDYDEYKKIKIGEVINVKWDYARNKEHNDKYWSILTKIVKHYNSFGYTTPEMLHVSIKYELGYVREVTDIHGVKHIIPDSTDFQRLGQKKFEVFYNMAMDLLSKLLGIKREELEVI
jgi:hypothetical protein